MFHCLARTHAVGAQSLAHVSSGRASDHLRNPRFRMVSMSLRRICTVSFFVFFVAALALVAEPAPDVQEAANRLAGSIYTGPSMTTLRELADGFGGRLTGSPAYNQAAEWAAANFRNYGIQNVRIQAFTITSRSMLGTAGCSLLSPLPRPIYLETSA